uniref:Uncharacterized protein n=1 Tax=Glossina brevipalpis TaxID=37001 RepID=A0A1A9X2V5_9MUSC
MLVKCTIIGVGHTATFAVALTLTVAVAVARQLVQCHLHFAWLRKNITTAHENIFIGFAFFTASTTEDDDEVDDQEDAGHTAIQCKDVLRVESFSNVDGVTRAADHTTTPPTTNYQYVYILTFHEFLQDWDEIA